MSLTKVQKLSKWNGNKLLLILKIKIMVLYTMVYLTLKYCVAFNISILLLYLIYPKIIHNTLFLLISRLELFIRTKIEMRCNYRFIYSKFGPATKIFDIWFKILILFI